MSLPSEGINATFQGWNGLPPVVQTPLGCSLAHGGGLPLSTGWFAGQAPRESSGRILPDAAAVRRLDLTTLGLLGRRPCSHSLQTFLLL